MRQALNGDALIGRPADSLTLKEQLAYAGTWIALERYTPATLPMRIIEAAGGSAAECARKLEVRGLSPVNFEFQPILPPR